MLLSYGFVIFMYCCILQDKDEIVKLHTDEVEARRWDTGKNVAKVLTAYTGIWSDELILTELR